jgi:hypothetical protein
MARDKVEVFGDMVTDQKSTKVNIRTIKKKV